MLTRTLPVSPFGSSALDREFDRMLNVFFDASPTPAPSPRNIVRSGFPPINVSEDEQAFFVEAELPGFKLADIDINLLGNELTLSGSREIAEPQNAQFHRRERVSGRFSRTLRLGAEIDAAKVTATLDQGVLVIKLPKPETAKPRKIDIKSN